MIIQSHAILAEPMQGACPVKRKISYLVEQLKEESMRYPDLQELIEELSESADEITEESELLFNQYVRSSQILNSFPTPVFEEDFTGAQRIIDDLKAQGISDLSSYLKEHPETVRELTKAITVNDVNDAAYDLYNLPRSSDFYSNLAELVVEASYDDFIKQVLAITGGQDYFEQEMRNRNNLGTLVHLILTMAVIDRDQNGVSLILVTVVDITELKAAQLQRRALEKKLEQSKRMEMVGRLAGGVAHNLNNMLVGIVSYPELLLMDMAEDDPLKGPLKMIRDSGNQASRIIQDLLTISRSSASEKHSHPVSELIKTIRSSANITEMIAAHPEVSYQMIDQTQGGSLYAAEYNLVKALEHIISNAFESIDTASGGEVSVMISPGTREGRELLSFRVKDTGQGLTEEDILHLYEPFYTTKQLHRKGTGLGMTVVWGVVEDHNGHISVDSEPGRGTEVTVSIPFSTSSDETWSSGSHMGNGETLIVVDDMDLQRTVMVSSLEKLGYHVIPAASGREAVQLIEHGLRPDLAVLDMVMPEMDGLETFRNMRSFCTDLPAVLISGYADAERVSKAMALGVKGFLKKPYSQDRLSDLIRNALR